jgi:ammonium transporter Rh
MDAATSKVTPDGANGASEPVGNGRFAACALGLQLLMIVLFALCTEYGHEVGAHGDTSGNMGMLYPWFQDVHVMIFIGFGFLMTFLKKYGFSSVGFNFMIGAFTIQQAILCNGFWHQLYASNNEPDFVWHKIELDITSLITGDFAAGAVLITFGGVLGKVSPLQLLVIAVIEVMIYGANETLGATHLQAVDMGGSIFVHTYGAYFGLACAWMLGPKGTPSRADYANNSSTKTSDMFAMIGTLFLWMYWPSFNGALAAGDQQHRVAINTVLSLSACCVSAFIWSALMREGKKFDMVDIQNATLAGGVAVGSSADLVIQPWGAIVIGLIAGFLSVFGYVHIGPFLEKKIGLYDTCGINNLHGMPGLMGGIGGAICAASAGSEAYGTSIGAVFGARASVEDGGKGRTAGGQGAHQMFALLATFCIAITGGLIAGFVAKQEFFQPPKVLFDDHEYWECPEEEEEEPRGASDLDQLEKQVADLRGRLDAIAGGKKAT